MLVKINEELEVNPEDVSSLSGLIEKTGTEIRLKNSTVFYTPLTIAEVKLLLYPPKPMTPKELAIHLSKRKNK